MNNITRLHREFWVGTLKRRNSIETGIVVYDPLARASMGDGHVVLYEVAESCTGEFRKEVVRDLVGSVEGYPDLELNEAIDAYCRFAQIDVEAEWRLRQAQGLTWPSSTSVEAGTDMSADSSQFCSAIRFLASEIDRHSKNLFLFGKDAPIAWSRYDAWYCWGILRCVAAVFKSPLESLDSQLQKLHNMRYSPSTLVGRILSRIAQQGPPSDPESRWCWHCGIDLDDTVKQCDTCCWRLCPHCLVSQPEPRPCGCGYVVVLAKRLEAGLGAA